jgi:putative pyruvate formate lyase activating enzyme
MKPSYLNLLERGELDKRVEKGYKLLGNCQVCPRSCSVNRLSGEKGFCRSGFLPVVASYTLHHGEEPPLSGSKGSGTIFFSNCNMRCVYCQNYPISQLGAGQVTTIENLSKMMLGLQERDAHNINLVTPSHFVPQIIAAVRLAAQDGMNIPLVYNTSGYDGLKSLELLDGVCDIYLTDFRYYDSHKALKYSATEDYPQVARRAIREMYRQVGELDLSPDGLAQKGLIVRHLLLPNDISDTRDVLHYLFSQVSPQLYLSIMGQYFPAHRAVDYPELGRCISWKEHQTALNLLDQMGISNGWVQEFGVEA